MSQEFRYNYISFPWMITILVLAFIFFQHLIRTSVVSTELIFLTSYAIYFWHALLDAATCILVLTCFEGFAYAHWTRHEPEDNCYI